MMEWIPIVLKGVDTLEKSGKTLSALIKGKKGAKRAILDEIRHNSKVCWLFLNRDADLSEVISELKHNIYDQLSTQGFDFNSIKKGKIKSHPSLKKSDLKFLVGKSTENLVDIIYLKIKDIKLTYKLSPDNPKNRFPVRVRNIQKRILLLIYHMRLK
ncbi:hypothetical protein ACFLTH_07415 [Bacteroidota bacterium]